MSLTKKDFSQIRGLMHGEVENLARIVARGFESIDKRFEQVDKHLELIDKRIEKIEAEIQHINARLNTMEHDISDIRRHFVYRHEFEDALSRISLLERKLGVRSGK